MILFWMSQVFLSLKPGLSCTMILLEAHFRCAPAQKWVNVLPPSVNKNLSSGIPVGLTLHSPTPRSFHASCVDSHGFPQCLEFFHLHPLLMHFLSLGCPFPTSIPWVEIHLCQISGSSLGYRYFQTARSCDQKCYSGKFSAHLTFGSVGQMIILNPMPFSLGDIWHLYNTLRKRHWSYEQTAKMREERTHFSNDPEVTT